MKMASGLKQTIKNGVILKMKVALGERLPRPARYSVKSIMACDQSLHVPRIYSYRARRR